jgi:serine/threonine protein phosphatase 1
MRWIIGDIHGMLRPLEALISRVENDDPDAQLFFAGDYVNRGPDSRGVVDLLLTLSNARFVRGNHDDVFDLILSGDCYANNDAAGKPDIGVYWFWDYGLRETFKSYGMTDEDLLAAKREPSEGVKRIRDLIPAAHARFFHSLSAVIDEDDLFVTHAYWYPADSKPTIPISIRLLDSAKFRRDAIWTRFAEKEIGQPKTWQRTGYFGHTPTYIYEKLLQMPFTPIRGDQMVLIDTAAANDPRGRLTAYCHETQDFIQADRDGNLVMPQN